jgi:hypothetical protein
MDGIGAGLAALTAVAAGGATWWWKVRREARSDAVDSAGAHAETRNIAAIEKERDRAVARLERIEAARDAEREAWLKDR